MLSCSMNMAGSLGPILTTLLLQYYDWRTILTMSGTVCAAFAFVCLIFVRNEPKDVGLPNIEISAKKGATSGEFAVIRKGLTKRLSLELHFGRGFNHISCHSLALIKLHQRYFSCF